MNPESLKGNWPETIVNIKQSSCIGSNHGNKYYRVKSCLKPLALNVCTYVEFFKSRPSERNISLAKCKVFESSSTADS